MTTTTSHTTLITTAGTRVSPDREDCPSVHTVPGREEAYVVVRTDVDGDVARALAGEVNPATEVLGHQPPWVPCGLMTLPALGVMRRDQMFRAGDYGFRLEQRPTYSRRGADFQAWLRGEPAPAAKQEWLDELATERDAGIIRQRVRILSAELTDYELYACQRGYALNAPFEDIRVLRRGEHDIPDLIGDGDYWVFNGIVVPIIYLADGEFVGGAWIGQADERGNLYRDEMGRLLAAAEPWDSWWTQHPELHDSNPTRAA